MKNPFKQLWNRIFGIPPNKEQYKEVLKDVELHVISNTQKEEFLESMRAITRDLEQARDRVRQARILSEQIEADIKALKRGS